MFRPYPTLHAFSVTVKTRCSVWSISSLIAPFDPSLPSLTRLIHLFPHCSVWSISSLIAPFDPSLPSLLRLIHIFPHWPIWYISSLIDPFDPSLPSFAPFDPSLPSLLRLIHIFPHWPVWYISSLIDPFDPSLPSLLRLIHLFPHCYVWSFSSLIAPFDPFLPSARFEHIYIVAVSFICGGYRSTRRKPPTCRKTLTNLITSCFFRVHLAMNWFELTTLAVIAQVVVNSTTIRSRPRRPPL
jgi:hypothetical protein